MTLAKTGKSVENGNVYSALLSNIWETFEQQGGLNFFGWKKIVKKINFISFQKSFLNKIILNLGKNL